MTKDEILRKLQSDTKLKGLSKNTQEEYYSKTKRFQNYYDKPATELTTNDIKEFLHYLLEVKGLTPSTINTYNSALRFLYRTTLEIPINTNRIPSHRNPRKFPAILTREEIKALLNVCDNLRDRCILMVMYSSGLRLNEVANLKVADIDSRKMQLFIRNGKGGKDRYAILSQTCLEELRKYWMRYRPQEWLFYSRNYTGTHITGRAIHNVLHKYKELAGIKKKMSAHTLRHSFATHLLEDGVDIFFIKQLLGHTYIGTTCIYLHMVKISQLKVTSPLDTAIQGSNNNA